MGRLEDEKSKKFVLDWLEETGREDESNMECAVCGKAAIAYWAGYKCLFVCNECAIHILPRLIADAMGRDDDLDRMKRSFKEGIEARENKIDGPKLRKVLEDW